MNKNILVGLNVILLAAVGFLYYKTYSGGNSKKNATSSYATNDKDSNCNKAHIAYVEIDSLQEHITYIKKRRSELEAREKRIENDWQSGMRGLEAKRDNFLKKGAAITQQEAEKFQSILINEQQAIEAKKQKDGQALSNESFDFNEDIQKQLREFLEEYNKEKKYMYILTSGTGINYLVYKNPALNITDDVIKGMNEKMKDKLK